MKRLLLAATAAVALTVATPVLANHGHGNSSNSQNNQGNSASGSQGQNGSSGGQGQAMSAEEVRALQIRRECDMFAFSYWRFHPDWQHCSRN